MLKKILDAKSKLPKIFIEVIGILEHIPKIALYLLKKSYQIYGFLEAFLFTAHHEYTKHFDLHMITTGSMPATDSFL